jgi:heptosyltransferase II
LTRLVVQTAFLGDVVLTTPLLDALAARYGPVDVVTTPAAAPLLETLPAVRRVIPYDKHGADRGLPALFRLARRLRAARYDAAYLPHRSLRTAALAWLARIPTRVGFRDGWPLLYTEARPRPLGAHEADRLLALADDAPSRPRPSVGITAADRAAADRFLAAAGITEPFVALAPGAIWGTKRWPYYAALAERLAERAAVVVVGSPDDAPLAAEITAAVRRSGGRAASGCGALTLRQAAEVIRRAALLVTNDSAPLHLAQAVATPTVAIFGSTIPAFGFGPRGTHDQIVELGELECRPCSAHGPAACPLGHHRCMRALDVPRLCAAIDATGALAGR